MARVTVEDCLKNVKNRFELVVIAAKRARQLMRGKEPRVDWDNDKPTVVALREIAAGFTNFDIPESLSEQEEEKASNLPLTPPPQVNAADEMKESDAPESSAIETAEESEIPDEVLEEEQPEAPAAEKHNDSKSVSGEE